MEEVVAGCPNLFISTDDIQHEEIRAMCRRAARVRFWLFRSAAWGYSFATAALLPSDDAKT
jgi:hypothetical protein